MYAFLSTLKNGATGTEREAQGCHILFMECEYWFKDSFWVMVIFSMHVWINVGFHWLLIPPVSCEMLLHLPNQLVLQSICEHFHSSVLCFFASLITPFSL